MLSYSSATAQTPLLGETIGANFERTVARFGGREALVDVPAGRRWTYAELDAEVNRLAAALIARGVAKGDRVGIWAPNCAEWVIVQYATAKIGAILVNVNPAYRAHELAYVVRQSGLRLLISALAHKGSDYRAMAEEIGFADVIYLGDPSWEDLLALPADPAAVRARMASLSADDPINIQYTSGTTGFPKGATLSHHNILNNGFFVGELLGYTEADRVCLPVPFYHCFGMVMGNLGAASHGACVVIPAAGFAPEATLQAVQQERCTALYGV
ncbi:AMP-binding protein, partial [Nonomuraea typhae]|uniref:AMP-binding protein n=1 Tax=Nonomuraea typhae TaxID=2603600 RepID=UPI0012FCCAD0